jgi:hypothetical protein
MTTIVAGDMTAHGNASMLRFATGAPSHGPPSHTQWCRLDSQSVKTTEKGGLLARHTIGFDGFKKIKGRKRHLLVDTQGLVLKVKATGAHLLNAMELTNCWSL